MSIEAAREVLRIEEEGLAAIRSRIGESFLKAVEMILAGPGRVVITGIGKSGIVGQKIAATMNTIVLFASG
jgi:arabinose-5-phosphate isomerase